MARAKPKSRCESLFDYAQRAVEQTVVFTDETCPFKGHLNGGDPRLLIITGDNASGKSLVYRMIASFMHDDKVLPITISIRERTGAGTHEMGGMRRVMMFGDEITNSTGATSYRVVETGFRNVEKPDEEGQRALLLDEPEIGLSESYAAALGTFIGQRAGEVAKTCAGVVLISHSRPLVRAAIDGLGFMPAHLHMGPKRQNLEEWLDRPETRTLAELAALSDLALTQYRAVHKIGAKSK